MEHWHEYWNLFQQSFVFSSIIPAPEPENFRLMVYYGNYHKGLLWLFAFSGSLAALLLHYGVGRMLIAALQKTGKFTAQFHRHALFSAKANRFSWLWILVGIIGFAEAPLCLLAGALRIQFGQFLGAIITGKAVYFMWQVWG